MSADSFGVRSKARKDVMIGLKVRWDLSQQNYPSRRHLKDGSKTIELTMSTLRQDWRQPSLMSRAIDIVFGVDSMRTLRP